MIENEKNREIDKVLTSLEGMQRAVPEDIVYNSIARKISGAIPSVRIIPLRSISVAAASVLLLVAMNIIALHQKSNIKQDNDKDEMQELVNYYGLTNNPYGI